ncbi:kinesin light chain : [Gemmata massiliana]|uniref:Kinesin light chain n=1 Tax=Gemmata massiliana TaxID=1210884 RepID=A0A6P2D218_9BACT|nr:kinesin light chain : [Gemmata massiliana]
MLNNLGMMYDKRAGILDSQDDLSSAIGYHKRALEIRSGLAKKGILRKNHHYIGRSHVNLGSVYIKAKRFEDDEPEFDAAFVIFKSSIGQHLIYIDGLRNIPG